MPFKSEHKCAHFWASSLNVYVVNIVIVVSGCSNSCTVRSRHILLNISTLYNKHFFIFILSETIFFLEVLFRSFSFRFWTANTLRLKRWRVCTRLNRKSHRSWSESWRKKVRGPVIAELTGTMFIVMSLNTQSKSPKDTIALRSVLVCSDALQLCSSF